MASLSWASPAARLLGASKARPATARSLGLPAGRRLASRTACFWQKRDAFGGGAAGGGEPPRRIEADTDAGGRFPASGRHTHHPRLQLSWLLHCLAFRPSLPAGHPASSFEQARREQETWDQWRQEAQEAQAKHLHEQHGPEEHQALERLGLYDETGTPLPGAAAAGTDAPKEGWQEEPGWGGRAYDLRHVRERPGPANLWEALPGAGEPSMVSRDRQHPQGSYPEGHLTPLQSHVAFFDPDADGLIWPGDTYRGFRRLGFSRALSALAVPLIHGAFSYATLPPGRWLPDPFFRVNVNHIHKAKHGSDSETFDTEGRWVAQKFEECFSKYGHTYADALTWGEIKAMCAGNKNAVDFFSWSAERLEWYATYLLCARPVEPGGEKLLMKGDVRGVLDGTLLYRIADDLESGHLQKRGPDEAGFKSRGGGWK